jgi:hypothetical protein
MKKDHTIIHDGCHISNYRTFFEWWYFDFDLNGKHHIYIEWQAPVFNSRDNMCMLIFRIYNHNNRFANNQITKSEDYIIKAFRYKRSLVKINQTLCDILFPGGHIFEQNGNYFIKVKERNLQINIQLERLLPPMIASDEVLIRTQGNDEFLSWNIPLPRALATGQIVHDGDQIQVDGEAYHDHNWGNINVGKYMLGWIWTRIFFDNYTLILGDITLKEFSDKVQVLLLIDKNGDKINISSLKIERACLNIHSGCKLSIPFAISFTSGNKDNYIIRLEIQRTLTIQEFPLCSFKNHLWNAAMARAWYLFKMNMSPRFIKKWFGQSFYCQFSAQGELYIDNTLIDTKPGNMEVISFAP